MTPNRFQRTSMIIKIGWGVRVVLSCAEYYLSASISQHLAGCWVMRAPFLLGYASA